MSSSPSDHTEKANEFGIDALKQIITLASGILALTITFIKDALGDSRSDAILKFSVPLSWVFLFLSIPFAWAAIVEAANTIGASEGTVPYVFDKHSLDQNVRKCLRFARYAQVCFVGGLLLLAIFAISNFPLFFREITPKSANDTIPQTVQAASPLNNSTIDVSSELSKTETSP